MKRLLVIGGILLALSAVALITLYLKLVQPYAPPRNLPVIVDIPQGCPLPTIAAILHREGLIRWQWSLRLWVKLHPATPAPRYGRYRFDRPLSVPGILDKLGRGQVELLRITVREGLTRQEMAQQLSRELGITPDSFLQASANSALVSEIDEQAPDLEGYLFPDTYLVDPGISAQDMVQMMVDHFLEKYSRNQQWRAHDIGLSNREVITLASLIEMETAKRDERFLISSVFHNRLRLKMRLDCDPTTVYALKRDRRWDGKFSWDDLKYDSPYNTRVHAGLPPGPICSPGYASIEAALYPEQTDYLYFVAKGGGSHQFSSNLQDHNSAVHQYIIQGKR